MELGARLRQARLEAGLSQRQLCGETITRNMLSLIEHGSAKPSMSTLQYLASRLGKPVSYFLEEQAVLSPNQEVMAQAREAYEKGDSAAARRALADYRGSDAMFDREKDLLWCLAALDGAEQALAEGRDRYAAELLYQAERTEGYASRELERRRLLLLAKASPEDGAQIVPRLPSLDDELLLRAEAALKAGMPERCAQLLGATEDQNCPAWNLLRGDACYAQGDYRAAAKCYHKAEDGYPTETAPKLESCYQKLEDYKMAYFYACKQK